MHSLHSQDTVNAQSAQSMHSQCTVCTVNAQFAQSKCCKCTVCTVNVQFCSHCTACTVPLEVSMIFYTILPYSSLHFHSALPQYFTLPHGSLCTPRGLYGV